jgi:hypothetical protein
MAEFETNRAIHPNEIGQEGIFIAAQDLTPGQQDLLDKSVRRLGKAGLESFTVDPTDKLSLLPHDHEREGSLGIISYEATMSYFQPGGLETETDCTDVWRQLRATSGVLARDTRLWDNSEPAARVNSRRPRYRPFMYVPTPEGLKELDYEQNRQRAKAREPVRNEDILLDVDAYYDYAKGTIKSTGRLNKNVQTERVLLRLLNDRIKAVTN